jgi:hypothetical protein
MPEEVIHEAVDVRRVAHGLGINHLDGSDFNAAAALEDRTILRHLGRLIECFRTNQEVSADDLLAFREGAVRYRPARSQYLASALQRIACNVLALIAKALDPGHPLLHLRLHGLRRCWRFAASKYKHEVAHKLILSL